MDVDKVFSAEEIMRLNSPVQTVRHRRGRCGVRSACDRLQAVLLGQSAPRPTARWIGVNSALAGGVAIFAAKSL